MSSVAASAIRHLEKMVEKIKTGIIVFSRNPPKLLEYIMVKTVIVSDKIEEAIVVMIKNFTNLMAMLQRSLSRSILLASLWFGLLFTMALLLLAVIYSIG